MHRATKPDVRPRIVPLSEVRHQSAPDCLHYERIAVRGRIHHWRIPTHRHEGLHQIQYLAKGQAGGTIDGRPVALIAPALAVIAPGAVHGFDYSPDADGHQLTIPSNHLADDLCGVPGSATRLYRSFDRNLRHDSSEDRDCAGLFEAIAQEFIQRRAGRPQALLWLANLLTLCCLRLAQAGEPEAVAGAIDASLVARFRSLIEEHYREHQPVAYFAEQLSVTADALARACRDQIGLTPLELLHERLIAEARRMLIYTPLTIADIAASLGFDDPAYFTRFFSRLGGVPPSQYRAIVQRG